MRKASLPSFPLASASMDTFDGVKKMFEKRKSFDIPVSVKSRRSNFEFKCEPAKKLARYERDGNTVIVSRYDIDEVMRLQKSWKEDFRKENRTDDVIRAYGRDMAYERFCKEIDDFILQNYSQA